MHVDRWPDSVGLAMSDSGIASWLKTLFGEEHPSTAQRLEDFAPSTLAACALLIEVSLADHAEDPNELSQMQQAMQSCFAISPELFESLLTAARGIQRQSVSLYEHTRILNDALDHQEKIDLIGILWTVAYADGHLDHYEEHLIRRVADLLYVEHRDFMLAKLAARDSQQGRLNSDG